MYYVLHRGNTMDEGVVNIKSTTLKSMKTQLSSWVNRIKKQWKEEEGYIIDVVGGFTFNGEDYSFDNRKVQIDR